MRTEEIWVETGRREITDLTEHLRAFCRRFGDGVAHVFLPHATAGLALLELGAGSEDDLAALLDRLLPKDDRYTHRHGSPGHGADHLLPVLLGPSLLVPVSRGELLLGTWQHVVLVDRNPDNPVRRVRFTFLDASEPPP